MSRCIYVGWMDVGLLFVGWMDVLEPSSDIVTTFARFLMVRLPLVASAHCASVQCTCRDFEL